jgi:DNA gyrase subunit A
MVNLLQLDGGEHVQAVVPIRDFAENKYFIMVTKSGMIKKSPQMDYKNIRKNGLIGITIKEDDELIEVKTTDDTRDIFMVSKNGMCIRFRDTDIRSTGRSSMGVRGMNLDHEDEVVGMQMNTQGDKLLVVTEKGMGKRTSIDEFALQRRGGKGLKCYKVTEKTGRVVGVKAVNDDHEVMLITTEGIIIQLRCDEISTYGRITSGVKLINLKNDETVKTIAKVRQSEKVETTDGEEVDLSEGDSSEGAEEKADSK